MYWLIILWSLPPLGQGILLKLGIWSWENQTHLSLQERVFSWWNRTAKIISFKISLFGKQSDRETGRGKERKMDRARRSLHLQPHSLNGCNGQEWARPKPGGKNFTLVSEVSRKVTCKENQVLSTRHWSPESRGTSLFFPLFLLNM